MTVLEVVQNVAPQIGIDVPDQVFSAPNSDRTMVEMRVAVNKAASQIAKDYDWSALRAIHTTAGGGTDFPLPADYDRMTRDADLFGNDWRNAPLTRINSMNEWLAIQQDVTWHVNDGYWTVFGKRIHVLPGATGPFSFPYITANKVTDAGGNGKPSFTADTDTFVLSEQLLELALIWNWRSGHGDDYAEDMANYQTLLAQEIAADRGNGVAVNDGYSGLRGFKTAYTNRAPRI